LAEKHSFKVKRSLLCVLNWQLYFLSLH